MHCTIALKFDTLVHWGRVIKAENDCRLDGSAVSGDSASLIDTFSILRCGTQTFGSKN